MSKSDLMTILKFAVGAALGVVFLVPAFNALRARAGV